ncbi:MAG TPA: AAA family ATPase [Thermoplasmata archaeon]|nr:AAA family ATPase [Thermoplasmata archaeon]
MAAEARSGRPFVGRVETVEALHRRFEDARAGTGGVTLLVGGTGVGKSALVAELVRDIRARGIRVMLGRALALDDPPPFSLIRSAIQSGRDDPALRSADAPLVGGDQFLIGFAPRLGDAGFPPPAGIEERLLEALSETDDRGESSRERVLTGIAEQFLEFTRHGPTVLILEDLHRADDSSLGAVEFLANQLQNRPLWILATSRPYASLSESGRARLEGFEGATHARRIVLRPMTSGEVADYLRMNDPTREFSPEEVARRYSETGGNPLLLQQLDRRISTGGEARGPEGAGLPPLDEEAHRTLDVAAVLGPEFTFGILLRASGEDEERLAEAVDRLVGQGLLFERPGELLAFPEDRLREEAYGRLTESRRRLLHRRAGDALEAMGSADLTTIYALARHFYLGRVDEKSVQYNRIAAEIAERALAPDVARDHLSRALESQRDLNPDDRDGESEIVLELARTTNELGRLQEAEGILRDFLDQGKDDPRLSPRSRATLEIYLARVLSDRGDWRAAAEVAEKVLSSPGLEGQLLVRLGAHRLLGEALFYEGHYPEAIAQHTEEIRLAREAGNERATALGQARRAGVLAMMGQSEQALSEAREAAAALERVGPARESAQAHLFLGVMIANSRAGTPRHEEAIAEFAQAIRLAEKAQDPRRMGWALFNTADILREAGQFEEAVEKVQTARDILERIGDRFGLIQSMIIRGKIAIDRGEYDLAEADLLEAYRLVRDLNAPADEVDVVLRLAQLSYARGDRASARRRVAELERRNLPALRPDIAEEFDRLKSALAARESDVDAP